MSKITVIGAGNVGATCAQRIVERGYADVVLVDIIEGLPQGKALDIKQSAPVLGFETTITGSNGYEETSGSDVVIITSGIARKPGMSRDDLLRTNAGIVSGVVREVASRSPDCILIIVTNPSDAMTCLALRTSGFPRNRVFGLSGVLDGARFASFIADELKVSPKDVSTCIMGQHGESMVVIPRLTTVKGRPLTELLPQETIARLVGRTINGGAEIVGLLKSGSAFYAPSAAAARMAEAVILDRKEVLCCAAYLQGEYGIKDTVVGVPVKLGRKGIEQIVEHKLSPDEQQALYRSAEAVRKLVEGMGLG